MCRTAQPATLASFPTWGSLQGAGRTAPTGGKNKRIFENPSYLEHCLQILRF